MHLSTLWRKVAPVLVLVTLAAGTVSAQSSDDVRQSFRRGVELFEQEQYDEALSQFERALAANPSSELALEMRNEAGYHVFVDMLSRRDDLATVARKVLQLAERGELRERQDAEKIRALVQTMLKEDDFEKSYQAVEELASRVGPFCVPYLVDVLADRRDNDARVKAIVLLSKLGSDGVNAVVELLYHPDDYVRQNACAVLGHMRDTKATPYLKAVVERKQESPHVRGEATRALQNLTGQSAAELDSATNYFVALAERYYQEHPTVMRNNFRDWALWNWKDGRLRARLSKSYMWNDEMAEKVCYAALDHARRAGIASEALDGVWTTLVATLFQQVVEVDALIEVIESKGTGGQSEGVDLDGLKQRKAQLTNQIALATARGEVYVAKALHKALLDGRALVAVRLIEQLRDMAVSESLLPPTGIDLAGYLGSKASVLAPLPAVATESTAPAPAPSQPTSAAPVVLERKPAASAKPATKPAAKPAAKPATKPAEPKEDAEPRRRRLSGVDGDGASFAYGPKAQHVLQGAGSGAATSLAAALVYGDKRVRYAAAEALLRLAPTKDFAGADKVVENLSSALKESGSRVVLVVSRDVQVRNRISAHVRELNHLPVPVATGREAVIRARATPVQDVILVHTELNDGGMADDFSVAEFIQQIVKDYRSAGTPMIVLTPRRKVGERRSLYPDAKAVVAEDIDPVLLKSELERLWSGVNARSFDPKLQATAVARAAAQAIADADPRTSLFKLAAATPALLEAVRQQPDEVRVAALYALGKLRARSAVDEVTLVFDNERNGADVRVAAAYCLGEALRGAPVPEKVFASLSRAMANADARLYRACGEAFGKARLSADQQLLLFEARRIE